MEHNRFSSFQVDVMKILIAQEQIRSSWHDVSFVSMLLLASQPVKMHY